MGADYLSKAFFLGPSQSMDDSKGYSSSNSAAASSNFGPPVSPYLNYDARFLQQAQPEFIFPEGSNRTRGRFELAFLQIGSSVITGASIGGVAGLYNGLQATALQSQSGKLRRIQVLNHIVKQGAATSNTFGTIAIMYSAFGVLLQYLRGEDDLNTVIAGTTTGLLYKSTAGLKRCAIGGGIGLGISTLYCLSQIVRQNMKDMEIKFL